MRFYEISISQTPNGTPIQIPGNAATVPSLPAFWTSYPGGVFNSAAQDVFFDPPVTNLDEPAGACHVRVWGVPLQVLNQAQLLQGGYLTISGGMGAGLPLNNPAQIGSLVAGYVQQAFGNWVGTAMTLDLVVFPSSVSTAAGTFDDPANLVLNWPAGQPLSEALANCFTTALPGVTQKIQISPKLVNSYWRGGYFHTVSQLAQFIRGATAGKYGLGSNYQGVLISMNNNTITATDGTGQAATPKQIVFTDLIGQPTWLIGPFAGQSSPNMIQVQLVLRGDLQFGDLITLPPQLQNAPGFATLTATQYPVTRNQVSFTGTWQINQMRHVGNFRSTRGTDWVTIVNCVQSATAS